MLKVFIAKVLALFFLIIFLSAIYSNVYAQEIETEQLNYLYSTFEHYGHESELSHPEVYDITKDSSGYLWIATADGLNRFDGYNFKTYKPVSGDSTSLSYNWVWDLFIDSEKRLWVCTRQGLNLYDPVTDCFKQYFNESKVETNICGIVECPEGTFWLASWGGALIKFEPDKNTTKQYIISKNIKFQNYIRRISTDDTGNIWLGTWGGLFQFNPKTEEFKSFSNQHLPECKHIISVYTKGDSIFSGSMNCQTNLIIKDDASFISKSPDLPSPLNISFLLDKNNAFWLGSINSGLFLKQANEAVYHFTDIPNKPGSLKGTTIWSIYEDDAGILWIGTNKGLNVLNPYKNQFRKINHLNSSTILGDELVYCFEEDKNGNIWVGTDQGLYELNIQTGKTIKWTSSYGFNQVYSLKLIDNKLWIGTNLSELLYFDLIRKTYVKANPIPENELSLLKEQIVTLETTGDILWIGTSQKDAFQYNLKTNKLKTLNSPKDTESINVYGFQKIFVDSKENIWFGSKGGGLRVKLKDKSGYEVYKHSVKDTGSLVNNIVTSIAEDDKGNIWIGTNGGLSCFLPNKKRFVNYSEKDGLPNSVISGITVANDGVLWISTNEGLSSLNAGSATFNNFDYSDGIQQGVFLPSSCFKDANGNVYFGGIKGLTFFKPENLETYNHEPKIIISSIKVMNRERPELLHRKEIILPFNENFISFEFAALDFINPKKNKYKYKLLGLDEDWIAIQNARIANYTGLRPGKYTFKVQAANSHGIWNEEGIELSITISAPWYLSKLAIFIYVILILLLLFFYQQYLRKRERLKSQIRLKELESEKLKELDNLKSRFFANISHEFRTPLTIINGITKKIKESLKADDKKRLEHDFEMIDRNGNNLLNLANQILDLAKLESNKLQLHPIQADVIHYLEYLSESYSSLASAMKIGLTVYKETDSLIMDFDPEQLKKVVANLLSNALKHTPENGSIIFHIVHEEKENTLVFKIKDNGIGMPEEIKSKVFERFYHGPETFGNKPGTGIGLSLTKELIQLMRGTINVKSTVGKGSEFIVSLPVCNTAIFSKNIFSTSAKETLNVNFKKSLSGIQNDVSGNKDNSSPLLLLIEDNEDVVYYINSCLSNQYQIIKSTNGEDGISMAIENIPDIIISDVMMPGMNGYEVCSKLKNNDRTNHIPIVLLTAKTGEENRIAGIASGADAYLEKPFNKTELLIQLEQLIKMRKQLQEKFLAATIENKKVVVDEFLTRAIAIIEKEMNNSKFNAMSLAFALQYSESQLYRKIKALSGVSTALFIRSIRLSKAKELLMTSEKNVSEIAYETGFNDPAWFSRSFKEEFGYSPSEFRKTE